MAKTKANGLNLQLSRKIPKGANVKEKEVNYKFLHKRNSKNTKEKEQEIYDLLFNQKKFNLKNKAFEIK